MKTISLTILMLLGICTANLSAQQSNSESYGKTLNLGFGVGGYSGYYGYLGRTLPVFHIDYEFDVANSFTLAPFVSFYSYNEGYYRETVIPIGLKGSYYLDNLLRANSDWDFYLGGSLGFAIVNTRWNSDYYGDRDYYHNASPLFLDLHVGAEYHLNDNLGLFLDVSTGVSTFGIAIH